MRVLPLLVMLSATTLEAQGAERYVLAGKDVAVYDLVGSVKLVAGSGAGVEVTIARGGPDAAKLEVQKGPKGGRQTLRVVFPGNAIVSATEKGWWNTQFRVRDDGTFNDDGGNGGRTVRISSRGRGLEAFADLTISVPKGQRISVYLGVGSVTATNIDGDITLDVAAASVSTEKTRGRLRLDTGSGSVTVVDAEGDLDLDTGSGDVTVTNVKGTRLVVDAGSGELTGSGIAVSKLEMDLGSGGARLSDIHSRDIWLDSGSGSVDLALAEDIESMIIDSGSGSVTLRLPPSLGAAVDIDTGSGGIESELPLTITHRSSSHLTGSIGDGAGRLRVDSGSGRVRLVKGP